MKLEQFKVLFDTEARKIRLTEYVLCFATHNQINKHTQESKNGDGNVIGCYMSHGLPMPMFKDLTVGTKFF